MASAKHYYGIFKYRTRIMTTGVDSSTDEKAIRIPQMQYCSRSPQVDFTY